MPSSICKTGDIFIAKNPYSNLDSGKIRPVLIISPDYYNNLFEDVIIVSITSKEKDPNFSVEVTNKDLIEEKLKANSFVRVDKPISISKEILEYKVTSLKSETLDKVKNKIKDFYQL